MARARTIKPEMLRDVVTANLSDREWRLFVSMLLLADDYGNLHADPAQVRGEVFWASDMSRAEVDAVIAGLERAKLILRYVVRGQVYAAIRNWSKHQRVDHPSKPQCPSPNCEEAKSYEALQNTREDFASSSRDTRETLALDRIGEDRMDVAPSATPSLFELDDPQQPAEPDAATKLAKTCVDILRAEAGKNYEASTHATVELARKLAKRRVTPEQVRSVVSAKVAEWLHDPKMSSYLRPATLLAPGKFFAYLDDLNAGAGATASPQRWRMPEV